MGNVKVHRTADFEKGMHGLFDEYQKWLETQDETLSNTAINDFRIKSPHSEWAVKYLSDWFDSNDFGKKAKEVVSHYVKWDQYDELGYEHSRRCCEAGKLKVSPDVFRDFLLQNENYITMSKYTAEMVFPAFLYSVFGSEIIEENRDFYQQEFFDLSDYDNVLYELRCQYAQSSIDKFSVCF